jgi:isopenicillin-N N-acyltransferase like protein
MLVMRVKGEPFARGVQHGALVASQARAMVRRFCGSIDPTQPQVRDRQRQMEGTMQAVCPEMLEEMRGIAEGAAMAYEDILLLNCSIEFGGLDQMLGCSNVILADTPCGTMHGFNHDVDPADAAPFVMGQFLETAEGVKIKRIVWAGTVWTAAGINNHGLTQGVSTVFVKDANWNNGIPVNVLTALPLLRCTGVADVIELMQTVSPVNHGYNFAFSDGEGHAAIVERAPTRCAVRHLEGKVLGCTNMYCTPAAQPLMAENGGGLLENSRQRADRLAHITADPGWSHDMDGLQMILRDHARPGGACQHADSGQAALNSSHSYIMIPSQRQLLVTDGLPCRHPYLPLQAWLDPLCG